MAQSAFGAARNFQKVLMDDLYKEIREIILGYAVDQTNGPWGANDLRDAGHPYAKRYGPKGNLEPLGYFPQEVLNYNYQRRTGEAGPHLVDSWRVEFNRGAGGRTQIHLFNISPYAKYHDSDLYPSGTSKMIRRGPKQAIGRRIRQEGAVQAVLNRVVRTELAALAVKRGLKAR